MIKTMLIYAPATILPRVAALGLVLIGAHLLPQVQYGYFSLVIVVGEIAEMTGAGWARLALLRLIGGNASQATIVKIALFSGISLLFGSAIVAILLLSLVPEAYITFLGSVLLYILANSCARFGLTLLQSREDKKIYSVLESLRALFYFFSSLLGMIYSTEFWVASLLGSSSTLLFGFVTVYIATRNMDRTSPSTIETISLISFGLPLVAVSLLSYGITSVDKLIIAGLHDKAVVGAYAVAFALGRQGFDVIANAINTGGFPRLINEFSQNGADAAKTLQTKTLTLMLAIAVPGAAALIASRGVLAKVLLPPEYETAILSALPLVAIGAIFLNIKSFIYDNVFHLHKKNLLQTPTLIAGALASVLTGALLLPEYPFLGASAMFAIGGATALLCSIIITHRMLPVTPEWRFVGWSCAIAVVLYALENLIATSAIHDWLKLVTMFGVGLFGIVASLAGTQIRSGKAAIDATSYADNTRPVAFAFISTTPHRITGLSSYTDCLVSAYARINNAKKIILLTNASSEVFSLIPRNTNVSIVPISPRKRLPFKIYVVVAHIMASWTARRLKARHYISTTPQGAWCPPVKQSIVIHDMYDVDLGFRSRMHVLYTNLFLRIHAFFSSNIICVSDATFADAATRLPFSRRKMHVIKEASKYPAINEDEATGRQRNGRILYVANVETTKNVSCLLEALRMAEEKDKSLLVNWIGRDPNGIVGKWIEKNGSLANFHSLGSVDNATLEEEYRRSEALVITSLKEGFCLPILEANSFGTPAIVSDISILREVAGNAGIFFNPRDPGDCLNKMMEVAQASRSELSNKNRAALENARKFSWSDSAQKLDALIGSSMLQ